VWTSGPEKNLEGAALKEETDHRFQRLLRLLSIVQEQPGQSAQELADHFGISKRNFFRDIKLLQDSGFSIESEGGYHLRGERITTPSSAASNPPGLNPWDQPSAGPVKIEIRLEPWLTRLLEQQPLHPSQQIHNHHLTLQSNPDRILDWLMSVQGAELLQPAWLRGSLLRRAEQIVERYR